MFDKCQSLVELDLSSFDMFDVNNIDYMFAGCISLEKLNLVGWGNTYFSHKFHTFDGCNKSIIPDWYR